MSLFDNIVWLYNFNGNARDGSGSGNHGWLFWSPTLTTDNLGNTNSAYNINVATQDKINLWNINIGTTDTSLFFWIKSNVSNYGYSWYYHTIFKKQNTQLGYYVRWVWFYSYMMVWWVSKQYQFTWVLDWNWHLIWKVKDSSTWKIYYYKDWVEVSNQDAVWTLNAYSDHFYYGYTATWSNIFNWTLWKMWLWDRAISASEALQLYNITSWNHSILSTWEYLTHSLSNLWVDSTGLVWLYSMNGNARDSSGNHYGNNVVWATLTTDQLWNANSAYNFDGTDDRIIWTWLSTNWWNFSVSSWVYIWNTQPSSFRRIVAEEAWSNTRFSILIWASANSLWFNVRDTAWNKDTYTTVSTWWHHCVITFDWTNARYYVDWNIFITRLTNGTLITWTTNVYFAWTTSWGNFNWKIWETRIYNRELSALEALQLYNTWLGKVSRIKGKTYTKGFNTNTPPTTPIKLSQKKGSLISSSLITL